VEDRDRRKIENFSKSFYWTPKDYYWQHTLQVRKFSLLIQEKEGGDRDVLEAAALLHDVGKAELLAPGHEELSAQIAEEFLASLPFDKSKIELVTRCIRYKDFDPLEARILRSADSMSLLVDNSGGREWYFENVMKGNRKKILHEIEKSWSEIRFESARKMIRNDYKKLKKAYA
jgi:putative nucleotidyltransferase with HDIG domain